MPQFVVSQARGTVVVEGLRIYARIGVADEEKKVGNEYSVDIKLNFPAARAVNNDDLEATINYARVVDIARECLAEPCDLLEHAVGRIFSALSESYSFVDHGCVALYKIQPPIAAQLSRVGFVYEW